MSWFASLRVWLRVKKSASSFKHKISCLHTPLCSSAPTLHPGGTTWANASFMITLQVKAVRSQLLVTLVSDSSGLNLVEQLKICFGAKWVFFCLFLFYTCLFCSPNRHTEAHTDTQFPVLYISGEEEHTVSWRIGWPSASVKLEWLMDC